MFRASSPPSAAARPLLRRCAVVAAMSTAALMALPMLAGVSAADPAVPFKDPNAIGLITLCDQNGNALTEGQVGTAPFVWSAHSDVAAPQGYAGSGRTAVLAGYQPRQGVDPGEWSGTFVSTVARYDDAAHPTVQETSSDVALRDLVLSYPPLWDHLLQLRLYLGAPGLSTYTEQYAALDLRISDDGRSWTALERGTASCHVGSAVSLTTLLQLATSPSSAAAGTGNASAPATTSPGSSSTGAALPASPAAAGASAPPSAAAVGAAGTSTGSSPTVASAAPSARLAAGLGSTVAKSSGGRDGAIGAAFALLAVVTGGWAGSIARQGGLRGRIHSVPQDVARESETR